MPSFSYDPRDHYWLRLSGKVYSSARMADIDAKDKDYLAFVASGGRATTYPKDIAGQESTADLAAVLAPYGLRAYPPTPEEVQAHMLAAFTDAIQKHLDDFAKARGYDGILSAATYATSAVPTFAVEGQYAVTARDTIWAAAYGILGAVQAAKRPMPTLEEVLAELPKLAWPVVSGGA